MLLHFSYAVHGLPHFLNSCFLSGKNAAAFLNIGQVYWCWNAKRLSFQQRFTNFLDHWKCSGLQATFAYCFLFIKNFSAPYSDDHPFKWAPGKSYLLHCPHLQTEFLMGQKKIVSWNFMWWTRHKVHTMGHMTGK